MSPELAFILTLGLRMAITAAFVVTASIVTDALFGDADLGPLLRELPSVTPLTRDVFDGATAERRLCDYFAVATMSVDPPPPGEGKQELTPASSTPKLSGRS